MPQIRQTLSNLWNTVSVSSWRDLLPPSVVSSIQWAAAKLPQAVGFGTPREQVVAIIVLIPVTILSSLVSAGATLVITVFLLLVLLPIALLRHIPAVNNAWPLGGG